MNDREIDRVARVICGKTGWLGKERPWEILFGGISNYKNGSYEDRIRPNFRPQEERYRRCLLQARTWTYQGQRFPN